MIKSMASYRTEQTRTGILVRMCGESHDQASTELLEFSVQIEREMHPPGQGRRGEKWRKCGSKRPLNIQQIQSGATDQVLQMEYVVRLIWRPLGPSFTDAHKFSRSFIFGDCRPILETFGDLKSTFFIYFNMNNQQCSPLCFTLQHSSILQGNLLTRLLESLTLTTRPLLGTIMSTFGLPSRRNGPPLLY